MSMAGHDGYTGDFAHLKQVVQEHLNDDPNADPEFEDAGPIGCIEAGMSNAALKLIEVPIGMKPAQEPNGVTTHDAVRIAVQNPEK